ncbi:MAG: 50S ribosomal protein L29 [Planctomycetales bacterium]|nr:50S ribosomal protein L29 [Planctomycetales bacterium]
MNANELREMSDEQLEHTLRDTCESFFRLRIQSQTERLDAPTELKRHRRLIARIRTLMRERELAAGTVEGASS